PPPDAVPGAVVPGPDVPPPEDVPGPVVQGPDVPPPDDVPGPVVPGPDVPPPDDVPGPVVPDLAGSARAGGSASVDTAPTSLDPAVQQAVDAAFALVGTLRGLGLVP
ncbi:MAG: hypothetical protein K1X95_09375, partial [Acidimicrobiia bacterium]|nr:hypothetical protein [Acidimicrobiia bacterium]